MTTVSVVIPARNAAVTVETAVRSAVGIDRLDEVVVVDDGSSDETALLSETSGSPRTRVLRLPGPAHGPSAARNAGAAATSSPVLLFLDADDWRHPAARDPRWRQIDDGAAVVAGLVQCHGPDGAEIGQPFRSVQTGSFLITRVALTAVGGFRVGMRLGEDVELFGRLRDAAVRLDWVDEVVLHYRLHPGSLSARRADRASGLLAGLHATVERRAAPK